MLKPAKYIVLSAIFIGIIFASVICVKTIRAEDDYGLGTAAEVSGLSANAISQKGDIPQVIGMIISAALSLVGVFFFLMILYAGFIWMTAAGSTEKTTLAKNKLQSAFIGLIIVLSAYAIAGFVFENFLSASGSCVKGGASPGSSSPDCAEEGKICGKGKKCVEECKYLYEGGKCIDLESEKDACDGKILSGLCPGGANIKCCVSDEEYGKSLSPEGTPKSKDDAAPSPANACTETKGGFCTTEAACVYQNGQVSATAGCAKGETCCKTCRQFGGSCVNIKDPAYCISGSAESGYCFGNFAGYLCCKGGIAVE